MINTILKYAFMALTFFFLAILQTSFLPYFSILGATANLIFVLFFLCIFFLRKKEHTAGFFLATIAGFFMDIVSQNGFGVFIITLLALYVLHVTVSNFLKESQGKNIIFYFVAEFCALFLLFELPLIHSFSFLLINLLYNLFFAIAGFYVYKKLFYRGSDDNQLKLL